MRLEDTKSYFINFYPSNWQTGWLASSFTMSNV